MIRRQAAHVSWTVTGEATAVMLSRPSDRLGDTARHSVARSMQLVVWITLDHNAPMTERPTEDNTENGALATLLDAIACRGDEVAFKQLFDLFAPKVAAFVRRLGADRQVAEDIAQDVMLSVWRRAGQYDRTQAKVSTWIFTIARNRRIDILRKERRPEFDADDPAFLPQAAPEPGIALDERRRDGKIREAVAMLPEQQARILRLAYIEDKTHIDIAEELAVPLGTVKSRIRLAMTKLRARLKDDL